MYTALVIGGGAHLVIATIGAIRYLEEEKMISHVVHYVGNSAGAFIAFLKVLGYTSYEMEDFIFEMFQKKEIISIDPMHIFHVYDTCGLNDGESILRVCEIALERKGYSKDCTFMDIAKEKGLDLAICAVDMMSRKDTFFCVNNTPDMPLKIAVRISCSIPLLFTPVTWKGKTYIDGFLLNNLPMNYIKNHALKDVLGIRCIEKQETVAKETDNEDTTNNTRCSVTSNVFSYLKHVFDIIVDHANAARMKSDYQSVCIHLPSDLPIDMNEDFRIVISEKAVKEYISIGYHTIKNYIVNVRTDK